MFAASGGQDGTEEKAFDRSLGVRFLEFLFVLSGFWILVASCALFGAYLMPDARILVAVVIVIEGVAGLELSQVMFWWFSCFPLRFVTAHFSSKMFKIVQAYKL